MLLGESTFSSYIDVCLKDKHISSCFFFNLSLSLSSHFSEFSLEIISSFSHIIGFPHDEHTNMIWYIFLFRKPPLIPLSPSIYCLPFLCTIPVIYFTVKLSEGVVSLSLLFTSVLFGLPQVGFHPCSFTSLAVVNITSSLHVVWFIGQILLFISLNTDIKGKHTLCFLVDCFFSHLCWFPFHILFYRC